MNNIKIIKGNLFDYLGKKENGFDDTQIHIAHGVNCVGAMGAGIAKEFKERMPDLYSEYKIKCQNGKITPGTCWVWNHIEIIPTISKQHQNVLTSSLSVGKPTYDYHFASMEELYINIFVYNLAIKNHWKMSASYVAMSGAIKNLIKELNENNVKEIAMPWIGCGLGGMSKKMVFNLLKKSFHNEEIQVLIYEQ